MRRFLLVLGMLSLIPCSLPAADVPASALLPESTVAFVRIDDVKALRAAFAESSMGKIASDPEIRPLLGTLYGGVAELFTTIGQQVGANLDELLNLPQGEFAFAVVHVSDEPEADGNRLRRDESPDAIRQRMEARRAANRRALQPVLIIDAAAQIPLLMNVIENEADRQVDRGGMRKTTEVRGTDVVSIERGGRTRFVFAERQGVAIIGITPGVVGDVVRRMAGDDIGRPFSQNADFTASIAAGSADLDGTPQLVFFVDPVRILEAVSQNVASVAIAYQVLESFGLDGLGGVGGTMRIAGEQFDMVVHLHVLLDSPRSGVLSVVQPISGPLKPEAYVPQDVGAYMTMNWDFEKTLDAIERTVDKVAGANAFEENVLEKFQNATDVDLRADLLAHLSGRASLVQWNEPPARLGSQVNGFLFELADPAAFQKSIATALRNLAPQFAEESYAGATLYKIADAPDLSGRSDVLRVGSPHVVLFDKYAMYTDSRKLAEKIVQTMQNPDAPRLKNLPEYELIMAEASARLDGREPFLTSFGQPEQTYRLIYDLAKGPASREALRTLADTNPLAAVVLKALEDHKLPPFSVISQYLAPNGGVMYDDATGLHSVGFTLKPL